MKCFLSALVIISMSFADLDLSITRAFGASIATLLARRASFAGARFLTGLRGRCLKEDLDSSLSILLCFEFGIFGSSVLGWEMESF